MHRLFVALRPPAEVRRLLAATMTGVPGARWQDDGQLHLTVRYIGPVDGRTAEDVAEALSSVHAPVPEVAIVGVGAFDEGGRVNALWAGVGPTTALAALHRKVDQALVRIGLDPERRAYLPHITLARLSRTAGAAPEVVRWQVEHAALASPPFRLERLVLYESHLGHEGALYEPVARWPLD